MIAGPMNKLSIVMALRDRKSRAISRFGSERCKDNRFTSFLIRGDFVI
jgi:hypothetical protein